MSIEINPYSKLVRMLELRLARQRQALADTELQLDGAKQSAQAWEGAQGKLPLATGGNKAK